MNNNKYNIPTTENDEYIDNSISHYKFNNRKKSYSRYIVLNEFGISLFIKYKL